ncbi:MAG: SOSS complex subunit B family protein [Nanoarchaeota archaeon]
MNIKDLTPRMGNVELVAKISDIGEVREFNKFGKSGRVATAKLKDDNGEIELSLWNEQIDQIGKGDTVKVTNGYVKEYQGEMQLTTGMKGSIEVVKKAEEQETVEAAPKEQSTLQETNEGETSAVDEERIED